MKALVFERFVTANCHCALKAPFILTLKRLALLKCGQIEIQRCRKKDLASLYLALLV